MTFFYHGEANVYKKNLDGFLAIAEELKLKGLSNKEDKIYEVYKHAKIISTVKEPPNGSTSGEMVE